MESPEITTTEICLNCGSKSVEKYCAACGQKFQPTKLPLRIFLRDAAETLFNLDGRWIKTLNHLFLKPGEPSKQYIEGRRAMYLPPLRVYISVSVVYFLLLQYIDSSQIFFIDFSGSEEMLNIGAIIQYSMFFLVPLFALFTSLMYRKREAFYVEYLILSLHIHSIWFVLFSFDLVATFLNQQWPGTITEVLSWVSDAFTQVATIVYLVFYLKKIFSTKWMFSIAKAFGIMVLYAASLIGVVALYYAIFIGTE